ncbi:MAG: hypothetical protein QXF01_00065 [Candidatus Micrarchaeaceae archaeon]
MIRQRLNNSKGRSTGLTYELAKGEDLMLSYMARLRDPTGKYYHAGIKPDNGLARGGNFDYLFGRDSLIFSWQTEGYDINITKDTLETLAKVQGKEKGKYGEEPGKIIHEIPSFRKPNINWLIPGKRYYFSVDSTPLFLIRMSSYVGRTCDESLWKSAASAVRWILDYGIIDGLLRYRKPAKEKGLQSQSWKDGIGSLTDSVVGPIAIAEVQGYAYAALSSSVIQKMIGKYDPELAARMATAARMLKDKFNTEFWSAKDNFFYLSIDGNNQKLMKVASNAGQLLFTGIIGRERAKAIALRLTKPDMWTRFGIRTHSINEPDFDEFSYQRGSVWPHDNWIIAMGMKRMGFTKIYKQIRAAVVECFLETGSAPEYLPVAPDGSLISLSDPRLSSPPCNPQAWTVGAMLYFFREIRAEAAARCSG